MSAERTGPRVVVGSDQALVAQALGSALETRGFEVDVVGLDGRGPAQDADVGLLLCELSTTELVDAARTTVAGRALRWVVVAPRGPGWGALLDAGATVVVDSSTSLSGLVELLGSLVDQTFVADPEVERELVREWELTRAEHHSREPTR